MLLNVYMTLTYTFTDPDPDVLSLLREVRKALNFTSIIISNITIVTIVTIVTLSSDWYYLLASCC